jgi:hypothetical protein
MGNILIVHIAVQDLIPFAINCSTTFKQLPTYSELPRHEQRNSTSLLQSAALAPSSRFRLESFQLVLDRWEGIPIL